MPLDPPATTRLFDPPVASLNLSIPGPKAVAIKADLHNPSLLTAPAHLILATHGAGGTHIARAMTEMVQGATPVVPILCFSGNSNLKSRASYFASVSDSVSDQLPTATKTVLCGRSMGARAAVLAYTELRSGHNSTRLANRLLLYSYPLTSGKKDQERTQILLDLPAEASVLFISGSRDSMCDMDALYAVRAQMRATTYIVILREADHGLEVSSAPRGKKKEATSACGIRLGELAVKWLNLEGGLTESEVVFDGEKALWSGWLSTVALQDWREQWKQSSEEDVESQSGKRSRAVSAGSDQAGTAIEPTDQRRSKRIRR